MTERLNPYQARPVKRQKKQERRVLFPSVVRRAGTLACGPWIERERCSRTRLATLESEGEGVFVALTQGGGSQARLCLGLLSFVPYRTSICAGA